MRSDFIRAVARTVRRPDAAFCCAGMIHIIVSCAGTGYDSAAIKGRHHVIGHRVQFSDDRISVTIERCFLFIMKANNTLYRDIETGERIQCFRRVASVYAGNNDIPSHNIFSIVSIFESELYVSIQ